MPTPRPRPAGAGRRATASAFMRPTAHPLAALVLSGDVPPPTDWPIVEDFDAIDVQLSHALGWVCEIRQREIVLINPLGEGLLRAELPALPEVWTSEVRAHTSAAIYLLDRGLGDDDVRSAINASARRGGVSAATVRTAIAAEYGKASPAGRNAPCPCGSGRKYKQCCGK